MRLKVIACKVLYREISLITARSPHYIDVTYMRQGLHNTPKLLNDALKAEVQRIDARDDLYTCPPFIGNDFDAIILGYGLCSNGIVGVKSEKYPIIVPKAHDCITLLLGSKEEYNRKFAENSGTFWYTPGWMENSVTPSDDAYAKLHAEYAAKFGEEEADFIMEASSNWRAMYKCAGYIEWEGLPFPECKAKCEQCAKEMGWAFKSFKGEQTLLEEMLSGKWDEKKFLIVPPGKEIAPSYDDEVITCS